MSKLASLFSQQQFCFSVEYLAHATSSECVDSIAGYPVCLAFADRVHSDDDAAPLAIAKRMQQQDALLHYSGKARDIADLKKFLVDAATYHYFDILMLTGDKLKQHNFGTENTNQRSRYLESVNSVMYAKQMDHRYHIGVAFNPFKYSESEREAQYFKLHKKIKAGADFIITQLGFDLAQLQTLKDFMQQHHYSLPMMSCVMPLTYPRAKFMQKHAIAGIVITNDLLNQLQQEYLQDKKIAEQKAYQRAALHILIAKHLGYAGIHLSGCEQTKQIQQLESAIEQFKHFDFEQCWKHYLQLLQCKDMTALQPKFEVATTVQTWKIYKYYAMAWLHDVAFQSKWAIRCGKWLFKPKFWQHRFADQTLLWIEHGSKNLLVSCDSCGQCRLAETLYICPETCPKGLANGPCGGTNMDRCEFGDRECIHSYKYRLAKQTAQQKVLKDNLIATVPIDARQHSSWVRWFHPKQKL